MIHWNRRDRIHRGCLAAALLATLAAGCGRDADEPRQDVRNGRPTTTEATPSPSSDARAGAPIGMLVTVDELKSRLDESNLRILDARDVDAYVEGHIPGAVSVETELWKDQALSENGLRDEEFWGEHVGLLGIDESTNVVVYAENPTRAARIWWTLKYVGVPQVALLDGGWPAWRSAGGETSTTEPELERRGFTPKFQSERVARIDDLKRMLEADDAIVIDARTAGEFAGTEGSGARQGRIPGAKHIEWTEFLAADGRFKTPEQIQSILAEKGVADDKPIVTHCQSGGRAALDAFALELAGVKNVRNYYCGWSEWSKDESAPVEK